ncbi:E3 ubiquitin-protein ligase TRIM7-like [Colossoma macropomum]|uniref:E3 ubiquitin-protein ligase TRIM7-like n=1 Tax=Colossoma macropomum TaxID=42526 RepID=UPI0018648542|nr:E3 ubiquitin-protein ligase TRIM7-like [Colossoma macropomum]
MYEEQLACVICQTSRKHRNHSFVPADEAAHDTRVDPKAALKILKEKLQDFKQAKETCDQEIQHIITQAKHAEKQIKKHCETLHQFLRNEEATRIAISP